VLLVNAVIFRGAQAPDFLYLTCLPTSVAAKRAAEAVSVTAPEVPEGVIVIAVVFVFRYGPSIKSITDKVQLV
jgi:hypothetical protein